MRHPRCLNCHTVADFPLQGEDSRRHDQRVTRGVGNMGAPTLKCFACHQSDNSPDGRVPGAHDWRLAPLHMGWERQMTDSALCEALKNRETNGNRGGTRLLEHLTTDHLVQWAFAPGARQPSPVTQPAFHQSVRLWLQTGMDCP